MGPLSGLKVVELGGIGPAPFCCMMLADMGADVIRVDRTADVDIGLQSAPEFKILNRGRRSIAVDLKAPAGVALVKQLLEDADIFVEGFRPGVAERLGLGPDVCLGVNPRLVYGRMTGWGQTGPLAQAAGHDINYIALTGALESIGVAGGPPAVPLNLVGDYGGGALYLAFGIMCALVEARQSGQGQVVDAAIVDGAAHLMASVFSAIARDDWDKNRGENLLSGGAPWYSVYETKDGKYISVGAVEGRFYKALLQKTGISDEFLNVQHDRAHWPKLRMALSTVFKSRTRTEWNELLEGSDVCFAPVLTPEEAQHHDHMSARNTFVRVAGILQPAPGPQTQSQHTDHQAATTDTRTAY